MASTFSSHRSLHPVVWVAAVAVILLAATGIAAITGVLPMSKSAESPAIPQPESATLPATSAAATAATEPVMPPSAPVVAIPAAKPQVIAKHVEPKHRRTEQLARADDVADAPPPPPPARICNDCGRIESIQRIAKEGDGSGVGAVAGGALGGVLGHNVGNGNGRTLATIAGVVGGAMLGNHVEKSRKETVSYKTVVRFDDGTSAIFTNPDEQGFREGERVRVVNGALQPE